MSLEKTLSTDYLTAITFILKKNILAQNISTGKM